MNLALWIVAGLLALLMLNAATKLFVPKEKLATKYGRGWMRDNSDGFVRTLGALELLAAVGLILPAMVDIAPWPPSWRGAASAPNPSPARAGVPQNQHGS